MMTEAGRKWMQKNAPNFYVADEVECWLRAFASGVNMSAAALCKKNRYDKNHAVTNPPCDHCIAEAFAALTRELIGDER